MTFSSLIYMLLCFLHFFIWVCVFLMFCILSSCYIMLHTWCLFVVSFCFQVLQSAKEQIKWSILKWRGPDTFRILKKSSRRISSPKAIFIVTDRKIITTLLDSRLLYIAINQSERVWFLCAMAILLHCVWHVINFVGFRVALVHTQVEM